MKAYNQKYLVDFLFTDETTKQVNIISLNMYKAYEKAMEIVLKLNKGINKIEIKEN